MKFPRFISSFSILIATLTFAASIVLAAAQSNPTVHGHQAKALVGAQELRTGALPQSAPFAVAARTVAETQPSQKLANDVPDPPAARLKRAHGFAPAQVGSGPFSLLGAVDYPLNGFGAESLAVADLNGDGKLDMVVVSTCPTIKGQYCIGDGQVSVLLGNGDGTFQSPVTYDSAGYGAISVAVADLNGDGIPDLAVANQCLEPVKHYGEEYCDTAGVISVFLGNGDGTFQPAVNYDSGGNAAGSVAIADMNGDGIPDLVVANQCEQACGYSTGGVSVLLGKGDGTFQKAVSYSSGGYATFYAAVADLRGNGQFDAIVLSSCENQYNCDVGSIGVLLGKGDGAFQPAVVYIPGGQVGSIAIGDVNGDGIPDLVVMTGFDSPCGDEACVEVMLGNGDGTFQSPTSYSWGGYIYVGGGIAIADLNDDRIPDLVMAACVNIFCYAPEAQIGVLLGNGDGTFQAPITYGSFVSYSGTNSIAVADVNGDGKPDVLAAISGNASVQIDGAAAVLLNNTGAPPTTIALASSANPIPVGNQVTYTATVSSQSGGALGGSVAFMDWSYTYINSAIVPLVNNQATFSTTYQSLINNDHWITAFYQGVLPREAGSTSNLLNEYVCIPTKTLLHSSKSPSKLGKSVKFRASVSSHQHGKPYDGEPVNFYDGNNLLGSAPLEKGVAAYITSALSVGTHVITAVYPTDDYYCQSSAQVIQVVEQ